jgi:hypothetical protein
LEDRIGRLDPAFADPQKDANRRRLGALRRGISIVGTLILLFDVDKIMGLRVTQEQEVAALDLSPHGQVGYDFNS